METGEEMSLSNTAATAAMGPDALLQTARGFFSSRIILTAAKLELFDRLPATVPAMARENDWDEEALRVLLDALVAINVLEKEGKGGAYRIVAPLRGALGRDADASVLPMIEHLAHLWERWSQLDDIVRSGRKIDGSPSVLQDPDRLRSFIGAMHTVGREMARTLAAELRPEFAQRLLDVGGASGTYAAAFLKEVNGLRATIFDLPEVIPMAAERLESLGVRDRVTLVPGDFYQDPLPSGHDLVWLSAITHQNSRAQNRTLFEKCFHALEPGGRLWIRDHVMDEARVNPPGGAIFAVNMLVGTAGGSTYTLPEFQSDLESVGYAGVRVLRNGDQMDAVLEAVRP